MKQVYFYMSSHFADHRWDTFYGQPLIEKVEYNLRWAKDFVFPILSDGIWVVRV